MPEKSTALTETIADCLLASELPPEAQLAALATNTAGVIFLHYHVLDRPQVRVHYAGILSGILKKMDEIKAASQSPAG